MAISRISILGVGLLGGSVALAAHAAFEGCVVMGYGHRPATLETALESGVIDEAYDDPAKAVHNADLVLLCTPVGRFDEILSRIAPALGEQAIVTDVGSTKRSIVASAERHLRRPGQFVGSHPIAGSEKRGVEYARADLFQNALCILTPTERTDPAALAAVESFWKSLGMRLHRMTPEAHDRSLCDVSHLPHAAAAALVAMQTPDGLELAGRGFIDATRIASGDAELWRDILLDNKDVMRQSLGRLQDQLTLLGKLLEADDREGLKQWLAKAADRRGELVMRKLKEMEG